MDLQLVMTNAALVFVATVWGSMVFFAAVFAPLVFTRLDEETAGRFIRQVFPRYYVVLTVLSAAACSLIAAASRGGYERRPEALIMLVVAIGFLASRQLLMPRINDVRDAAKAGDPAAERRFSRLHRLSVWINTAQMAAVLWVLLRLR